jgi:hypothetical protein
MTRYRLHATGPGALMALLIASCHPFQSGPSDQDVTAVVRTAPPSPPTMGPTYLAEIASVEVQERGRYNGDGGYWPVRVRVRGGARTKLTSPLHMGVLAAAGQETTKAVDFVEDARFTKDDFGNWRVSYAYSGGPGWRRAPEGSR